MYIIQQLVNGICQGSIYALLAIGFTLIVGVVGLVTFAYGETLMLGAMAAYYAAFAFHTNLFFSAVIAFTISAIFGIIIHKIAYERFLDAPKSISLLCTIGCSMLIKNLAQIICGVDTKAMPKIIDPVYYDINGVRFSNIHIVIIATAIVLALFLSLILNKTKLGLQLRAVSQDRMAAALVGISVSKATMIGNCIGTGIGGVAGLLISIYLNTTSATMGSVIGIKAITCCVLGGLTNIPGAALGGLVLGIIENLGIVVFPSTYRDLFAFAFLVIALMFKPQGLFVWRKNNK